MSARPGGARTPEEIEARLRSQREALSSSVDELAARVDPRVQARQAREELREQADTAVAGLRERAAGAADRARRTVEEARAGDAGALGRVAAVVGSALAASLVVGRLLRR